MTSGLKDGPVWMMEPVGTMESDTLTHQELVEQIAQLARSMNGKEINFDTTITSETDVIRDLRLDSLAAMDFIMALEIKFDTLIPVDSMAGVRTVGDLADLLQAQARVAAAA